MAFKPILRLCKWFLSDCVPRYHTCNLCECVNQSVRMHTCMVCNLSPTSFFDSCICSGEVYAKVFSGATVGLWEDGDGGRERERRETVVTHCFQLLCCDQRWAGMSWKSEHMLLKFAIKMKCLDANQTLFSAGTNQTLFAAKQHKSLWHRWVFTQMFLSKYFHLNIIRGPTLMTE